MSVNIVFIDKYFKLLHEHFTRVCACTRVCTSNLCVVTCGVGGPSVGARAPGAELTERQRTQSLGSGAAERAASDVLLAAAGPPVWGWLRLHRALRAEGRTFRGGGGRTGKGVPARGCGLDAGTAGAPGVT